MAIINFLPVESHAQNGGWAAPKGEQDFLKNRYPELKGLTNTAEDQKKALDLCSKYGGSNQGLSAAVVRCNAAARVYMSEGQKVADAEVQQQAVAQQQQQAAARQHQQSAVEPQQSQASASASASVQPAVEPISSDDMVDMLAKALVQAATQHKAVSVCGANSDIPQCEERLKAFDDLHFPSVTGEQVAHASNVIRHGSSSAGFKQKHMFCSSRFSASPVTFRNWGLILRQDESQWEANAVVSQFDASGCSQEEIDYFGKIANAALERAENVVSRVQEQAKAKGKKEKEALDQCRASATYKRFDAAASIASANTTIQEMKASIQSYQRVRPTTVADANEVSGSIARANDAISYFKNLMTHSVAKYESLGGNINDQAQMSKDASSNPCESLGDYWQLDTTD